MGINVRLSGAKKAYPLSGASAVALNYRFDVSKLVCYGCAHSAASVSYPSRPSGERACMDCLRALNHDWKSASEEPTDKYRPLDMLMQTCSVCQSQEGWLSHICSDCNKVIKIGQTAPI